MKGCHDGPPTRRRPAPVGRSQELARTAMSGAEPMWRCLLLQVTFHDAMTSTQRRERVTSELEAKKLAFYLFWNVKADFARWARWGALCWVVSVSSGGVGLARWGAAVLGGA